MTLKKLFNRFSYLKFETKRFPFISECISQLSRRSWVGKLIQLQLTLEKGNFYLSIATKIKYAKLSSFFVPNEWLKCICIGIEHKGLASNLRVRFVESGIMVERKIHICSMFFVGVLLYKATKARQRLKTKAKLYYFNPTIIKKYLNIHYYS